MNESTEEPKYLLTQSTTAESLLISSQDPMSIVCILCDIDSNTRHSTLLNSEAPYDGVQYGVVAGPTFTIIYPIFLMTEELVKTKFRTYS